MVMVLNQLWEAVALEQWAAALRTPFMQQAHMGWGWGSRGGGGAPPMGGGVYLFAHLLVVRTCLGKDLGGRTGWCQNCHSSKMSTNSKQGERNHFQKLYFCAVHGTPLKPCLLSAEVVGGGGIEINIQNPCIPFILVCCSAQM